MTRYPVESADERKKRHDRNLEEAAAYYLTRGWVPVEQYAAQKSVNAELLAACKSAKESLEQLIKLNRIPANNAGLRDINAAIARAEAVQP